MDLNLKLNYNQLLSAIKDLPLKDFLKLKGDIMHMKPEKKGSNELHTLLISGPTMPDEQYEEFLKDRERFNLWRTK